MPYLLAQLNTIINQEYESKCDEMQSLYIII